MDNKFIILRKILWILLFIPNLLLSQEVGNRFNGALNIYASTEIDSVTYEVDAFFNDPLGKWVSDSITTDHFVYISSGDHVCRLSVDSVISNSGSMANLILGDPSQCLDAAPAGLSVIQEETPTYALPTRGIGGNENIRDAIRAWLAEKADGISGGSGTDNDGENIGDGDGVYAGKDGDNLQFKSLKATGANVSSDDTTITIVVQDTSGYNQAIALDGTEFSITDGDTTLTLDLAPLQATAGLDTLYFGVSGLATVLSEGDSILIAAGDFVQITGGGSNELTIDIDLSGAVLTANVAVGDDFYINKPGDDLYRIDESAVREWVQDFVADMIQDSTGIDLYYNDLAGKLSIINTNVVEASYVEMYVTSSDPDTLVITAGTPEILDGATIGDNQNFSFLSGGRLLYGGTDTIQAQVVGSFSILCNSNGRTVSGKVYKNAVAVESTEFEFYLANSNEKKAVPLSGILELTPGDTIDVRLDISNSATVIAVDYNLNVTSISNAGSGSDNQTLAEVLSQGNVAGDNIDMGGNDLEDVGAITVTSGNVALSNNDLNGVGNFKVGATTDTTDGSGDIMVAHGHSGVPSTVHITLAASGTPLIPVVGAVDGTNFTVRFYNTSGAAVTSTSVSFYWTAR